MGRARLDVSREVSGWRKRNRKKQIGNPKKTWYWCMP